MRRTGEVVGQPHIFLHLNPDAKDVNYFAFQRGNIISTPQQM